MRPKRVRNRGAVGFPSRVLIGCRGKQKHATKGIAEAAIRSLVKREMEPRDTRLSTYWCVRCRRWHIGHSA